MEKKLKQSERRALILTALPVEYQAVRTFINDPHEKVDKVGTVYEIGTFVQSEQQWTVCLCEVGQRNVTAATFLERALDFFSPHVALFVGVAGGIKDVKIGDVVAATKIYSYESGKEVEGAFLPRPEVGHSSHRLVERAKVEARKDNWHKALNKSAIPSPTAFIGPIAAGEKVIASNKSPTAKFLRQSYSDALAVEMEGAGFLNALHVHNNISGIVIRGISDLLTKKAQADSQGSQQIASENAAAFAMCILGELYPLTTDNEQSIESNNKDQEIPEDIKIQLNNALDLMDNQDFKTAIPLLRDIIELSDTAGCNPASAHSRAALANAIFYTSGDAEGINLLREALQIVHKEDHSLHNHILVSLGLALTHEEQHDEAEAVLDSALQEAQHLSAKIQADTELSLGNLFLHINRQDEAFKLFRIAEQRLIKAVMESNDNEGDYARELGIARVRIGEVLFQQNRLLESLKVYESAASTFRSSDTANLAVVYHQMGKVFEKLNRDNEAIDQLSRAARNYFSLHLLFPLYEALTKLAELYIKHTDWDNAHEVCQQLISFSPKLSPTKRIKAIRLMARVIGAFYTHVRPNSNDLLQEAFNGLSFARKLAEQHALPDQVAGCAVQAFYLALTTLSDDVIANLKADAIVALHNAIDLQREPHISAGMHLTLSGLLEDNQERKTTLAEAKRILETDPKKDKELSLMIDARLAMENRERDKEDIAYRALIELSEADDAHLNEAHMMLAYSAIRRKSFNEAETYIDHLEKLAGNHHNVHREVHDCRLALKHAKLARRGTSFTLSDLQENLHSLLLANKESPKTVLGFWYSLWEHELENLLRSVPRLTFLTVGLDATKFIEFTQRFDAIGDYFLMADLGKFSLSPENHDLLLPENWQFPDSFDFTGFTADGRFWKTLNNKPPLYHDTSLSKSITGSLLPNIPAFRDSMPDYILIRCEEKECIHTVRPRFLQAEGASLMIETPIEELKKSRSLWAPIDAYDREDKLLSILTLSRKNGYIPVFFERWPLSDQIEKKASILFELQHSTQETIFHKLKTLLLHILQAPENAVSLLNEFLTLQDNTNQHDGLLLEIALFGVGEQGVELHPAMLFLNTVNII